MIDLSNTMRPLLDGALDRAKGLEASHQPADAAAAWDEAVQLALKYAEHSLAAGDRQRRLQLAAVFRENAQRCRDQEHQRRAAAAVAASGPAVVDQQVDGDLEHQVRSLVHRASTCWDDIAGLAETKRLIQTAYAISLAKSPLGVVLNPTGSVLLFGPPGCGKTLMAAATSHSLDATFYSVQIGSLLSKWFGESSRLVSALYREARRTSPSVVFIDELDGLARHRDGGDSQASRQILANLLSELDGVVSKSSPSYVLTIAATNRPWDLDPALLSRFARQIYVPLPDAPARAQILQSLLGDRGYVCDFPLSELTVATAGMTGRELEQLTAFLIERMIWAENPRLPGMAQLGRNALENYQIVVRPLVWADIVMALGQFRPRTPADLLARYDAWRQP